jgi:hypothetical protein
MKLGAQVRLYDTMESYSKTARVVLAHTQHGEGAEGASEAIRDTPADTEEAVRDLKADEAKTRKALGLLGSRRNDRYEAALAALREDTRDCWTNILTYEQDDLEEGEALYSPNPTISGALSRGTCCLGTTGAGRS